MEQITKCDVYISNTNDKCDCTTHSLVGTLALTDNLAAFEYSDEWLINGYSISPFSLPLEKRVFIPEYLPFDGLFGIFSDSLPDGWGRLLLSRVLRKQGRAIDELLPTEWLSIVGANGMGALEYYPETKLVNSAQIEDFDLIAQECANLLEGSSIDDIDVLYDIAGSSGGARPKAHIVIDGEDWIIKFPMSQDDTHAGIMEYEYSLCAKHCGIEVPQTKLIPSKKCPGFFAIKRFDRSTNLTTNQAATKQDSIKKRIHMASASAILETSHRIPNLDYNQLFKLIQLLTNDAREIKKMFKLMCFNVFAHNRDDHSKNFTFLCENGKWRLSPAYDLTYSTSIGGEHATTIDGNGKNPGLDDILRVAKKADLSITWAKKTALSIKEIVFSELKRWL